MKYTELMAVLSETNKNKQSIIIYFEDGLVFISSHNTGVFESNNCLEMDDEQYLEYYACAVEVTEILKSPHDASQVKVGSLIEVSEINEPLKIELRDGQMIWKKK